MKQDDERLLVELINRLSWDIGFFCFIILGYITLMFAMFKESNLFLSFAIIHMVLSLICLSQIKKIRGTQK